MEGLICLGRKSEPRIGYHLQAAGCASADCAPPVTSARRCERRAAFTHATRGNTCLALISDIQVTHPCRPFPWFRCWAAGYHIPTVRFQRQTVGSVSAHSMQNRWEIAVRLEKVVPLAVLLFIPPRRNRNQQFPENSWTPLLGRICVLFVQQHM